MKRRVYIWTFILLLVLYILLALLLPADPSVLAKYNITELKARLLGLTISVPIAIIYLSALYGFDRFKIYAKLIAKNREGKAFNLLANGLMVLGFSLPVNSIISSTFNYLKVQSPQFTPSGSIIRNYIALLFQLVAFTLISRGAIELLKTLKPKVVFEITRYIVLAAITGSVLFTYLVTARGIEKLQDMYHMPVLLVLLTIVIP